MLMLHETVNITIECDGGIFMAEDLRQGFHVHAALDGARGERVPQGMKSAVRDM